MKKLISLSVLLVSLLITSGKTSAQQRQTMQLDASTSMIIHEFSAVLEQADDEIKVRIKLGREETEPGQDKLEQGDVLIMMNGSRIKDIPGLREEYEAISEGSDIKFGVRRGEQRFIITRKKGAEISAGGGMVMRFETDGDGPRPTIVPELGLLLEDGEDGDILVAELLEPVMPDELKSANIRDYTITKLNGAKPDNAAAVQTLLAGLEVGAQIDITFSKAGNEKAISLTKSEPRGNFNFTIDN